MTKIPWRRSLQSLQLSQVGRRLMKALQLVHHYRAALLSRNVLLTGVAVLLLVFGYRELRLRQEVVYVLANASAEVARLFFALEAREAYSAAQILDLTREEVVAALDSKAAEGIFLQVIHQYERLYFDTRSGDIRGFEGSIERSVEPRLGTWIEADPALYVDRDLTGTETWTLRAGVRWQTWTWGHLRNLMIVIVLYVLIIVALQAHNEADHRRRFGGFVDSMVHFLRYTDEATLVDAVPQIVSQSLGFDAVGLYLCHGDEIVPTAAYVPEGDAEAFRRSTETDPIRIDSEYPEARAVRNNDSFVVADPSSGQEPVHQRKLQVTGGRPYALAVMPSDDRDLPIGLLSAQHHRGLQPEHLTYLTSAAQLVALLIERFRSRDGWERMYQQSIRNTRALTIGTVVPFVAHNMRTPLTIIAQLAKSLRHDPGELAHDEASELLIRIETQAQLCTQLLRRMSLYRKLGNVSNPTVCIPEALDRVCDFFAEYFRIKNIDLLRDYRHQSGPHVTIDELEFVQVITNLLVNAEEAFDEEADGTDLIRSPRRFEVQVRVDVDAEASRVQIAVQDNGPGIGPENIGRIFEEDFTTKDFGTGVGLPYCRTVVRRAKGDLVARTDTDSGACFLITLPILPDAETSTEPAVL